MKLPNYLLRQEVTIERYKGNGAYGPMYEKAVTARCRIEPSSKIIRNTDGTDTQVMAEMFIQPTVHAPKGSKVSYDGTTYVVLEMKPAYGMGTSPSHLEVMLG